MFNVTANGRAPSRIDCRRKILNAVVMFNPSWAKRLSACCLMSASMRKLILDVLVGIVIAPCGVVP